MKRVVVSSLSLIGCIAFCHYGYGFDLSGSILDEHGKICPNFAVLLNKQESPEEIEQAMLSFTVDSKQASSLEEFNAATTELSSIFEDNKTGWASRSDDLGHFAFTNLTSGKYILTATSGLNEQGQSGDGYVYPAVSMEITSENISGLTVAPVKLKYFTAHGNLLSIKAGRPITADVGVLPLDPASILSMSAKISLELLKSVKADENGYFFKPNLPAGEYSLELSNITEMVGSRSRISFQIRIHDDGQIDVSELYRTYLSEMGVDVKLWTTQDNP